MSIRFITKEEIDNLPDDPEEAFVILEEIVRDRYEEEWRKIPEDEGPSNMLMHQYMSEVLPAANHFNIEDLKSWKRPTDIHSNESYSVYSQFMADVDYCVAALKLRSSTRLREHSVALDEAARTKLQHLLSQLRDNVKSLNISDWKKDAIFKKINALQDAIDRERTGFAEFGALMIVSCDAAGEAAKILEPVIKAIERIGAAIGIAKRAEDAQPRLPPKRETKRIEDKSNRDYDKSLDDEIPF